MKLIFLSFFTLCFCSQWVEINNAVEEVAGLSNGVINQNRSFYNLFTRDSRETSNYVQAIFVLITNGIREIGLHGIWPSFHFNRLNETTYCTIGDNIVMRQLSNNLLNFLNSVQVSQNANCINISQNYLSPALIRLLITTYRANPQANAIDNVSLVHEFMKHGTCDYWLVADFEFENHQRRLALTNDINNCLDHLQFRENFADLNVPENNLVAFRRDFKNIILFLIRYVVRERNLLAQITVELTNINNILEMNCNNPPANLGLVGPMGNFERTNISGNQANTICAIEYHKFVGMDVPEQLKMII